MNKKNIFLKWISPIPTLLLLFLIFGFSAQDGPSSSSLSFKVSLFLVQLFSPLLPVAMSEEVLFEKAEFLHFFIRKAAHMTEYFLLALSLQLPLTAWFSKAVSAKLRILIGFLITVVFAVFDEFHQTFVPGRSGNFIDVGIDSLGAFIASLFLLLFYSGRKKKLAV